MAANIDQTGNQTVGSDAIWQAVITLVNTRLGRQLRRPDYGLDLLQFIGFTPAREAMTEIQDAIRAAAGSRDISASLLPDGRIEIDFSLDASDARGAPPESEAYRYFLASFSE